MHSVKNSKDDVEQSKMRHDYLSTYKNLAEGFRWGWG
jgi:hypothetical protein